MTATIKYSREGHVGRLVLNNPERHNSLGREQLEAIQRYLDEIAADNQVRVLVLTGTGEKTFCAGASLQELGAGEMGDDLFQTTAASLATLEIPTVCALNGNVFGGGVELALSCDFRIGVEGSRMRVPAAAIGLCYPPEGISRYVEHLGLNTAMRILVASEQFDAQGMLKIGFLDQLVLPGQLAGAASDYARHIAGLAPLAVKSMKRIVNQVAAGKIDYQTVRALADQCLQSADLQEGLSAQREKREPRFTGK